MICVSALTSISMDLLAFFVGFKQHYYMTLTYIMFALLIAFGNLAISFRENSWFSAILNFFILGLAYDLRIIRNKAFTPGKYCTNCHAFLSGSLCLQCKAAAHPLTQCHVVVCNQSHTQSQPGPMHYPYNQMTIPTLNSPSDGRTAFLPTYDDSKFKWNITMKIYNKFYFKIMK